MKIPNKIKVGGITWSVELVEVLDNGDNSGRLNADLARIQIEKKINKDLQAEAFLHEIFHAINIEIDEQTVEFLAQALYQVMSDNKLCFYEKESHGEY